MQKNEDAVKGDPNEKIELGDFYELQVVDWTWSADKKRESIMKELQTVGFFVVANIPGHDEKKLLEWG